MDPRSPIWDKFLQERIGIDDSDEAQGGELGRKIDIILDMVQAMRKLGHGGAIIIVPDDGAWHSYTDDLTYLADARFTSISENLKQVTEAWGQKIIQLEFSAKDFVSYPKLLRG